MNSNYIGPGRDSGDFIPNPLGLVMHIVVIALVSFLIASWNLHSFKEALVYSWGGIFGVITWAFAPIVEILK